MKKKKKLTETEFHLSKCAITSGPWEGRNYFWYWAFSSSFTLCVFYQLCIA